jgi:hypothetical protein
VEKSGSLNLGVEGIMAVGAIFGYICGCFANSLGVGILVAFLTGALCGLLFAVLTVSLQANQNITGLTIDKAISGDAGYSMDENQTFLFRIEGLDDDVDLIVTIHVDSQMNIEGLTVGNRYKITELTGWSWRYGNCTPSAAANLSPVVDGNSIIVTLGADRSMNIVTFTNTFTVEKWIDGDAWCDNLFKI